MAQRMDPMNYENMINALNTYARQVNETIEKLYGVSAACKQVLGDDDIIATNLDPNIKKIADHYLLAAEEAKAIAAAMQQELAEYYDRVKKIINAENDTE